MDVDQETPQAENLRKLPYSELKKVAAKFGITRKMKSEKLIAAIMSKSFDSDEIFSTPAAKELNSSRKNKEKKFDEVQMTPLATPRRGTYSLDSPSSINTQDLSSVSLAVTTSVLDISNVTISRGSERKLRPRKVSFMSPAVTPRTPRSQSLRNRPKTPVASRTPLRGSVSSTTPSGQHKRKSLDESFLGTSTPQAKTVKFETDSDMESTIAPEMSNSTPLPSSTQVVKQDDRLSRSKSSSQNVKSNTTKEIVKEEISKKKGATPSATKAAVTQEPTSVKRGMTPNFSRIHQKAFDKMESIDDYQKRKLMNSAKKISERPNLKSKVTKAKSKIPAFSGIPFIPSTSATTSIKMNSRVKKNVSSVDKPKAAKENTPQRIKSTKFNMKMKNLSKRETPQSVKPKSKFDIKMKNLSKRETPQSVKSKFDMKMNNMSKRESPQSVKSKAKFDLKASLSRKLGYKPYKGPVKPLSESNNIHASLDAKEPVVNKVVKENRLQARSVIRGVRMNKRFELQMRNRKLD